MKKHLSFFIIFVLIFIIHFNSKAQITVTLGTGTTSTTFSPINSISSYSYAQMIYLGTDISSGGGTSGMQISKLRFYLKTAPATPLNCNNWTIYIGNISASTVKFLSTTSWIPVGSMTQVYSGTFTYPTANNWIEFTLTTPFVWNGGNLVIAVDENAAGNSAGGNAAFNSTAVTSANTVCYKSNSTDIDPAAPPSGTLTGTRPNCQLVMGASCTAPTSVNLTGFTTPICGGSNPGTFTASPVGGSPTNYSYLWYKNGVSTGVSTQTYAPGALASNSDFYCLVSTGTNCTTYSGTTTINVTTVSPPTGSSPQAYCYSATIADIIVNGTDVKWYDAATAGNLLTSSTALVNGHTYYASETIGGCESQSRLAVVVAVTNPTAPTGNAAQTFCGGATVISLTASGSNVNWYDAPTGGMMLFPFTPLIDGSTYYAGQNIAGCESQSRLAVSVSLTIIPPPTGNSMQVFLNAATVADLTITGTDIKWYSDSVGGNLLSLTDTLIDGHIYYASQTLSGCESQVRFGVSAIIILIKTIHLHLYLEGLYNPAMGNMLPVMDGNTNLPQWGYGIADRIQVDLFDENAPYAPIGVSISGIDLDTSGRASFQVSPTWSGNYFIRVRNRNHLETWSSIAVPFNTTNVYYDFTTSLFQAYGSNPQVLVKDAPLVYAFYLGDLDQGGWIDAVDFNLFEPDLTSGSTGFSNSDFDGGGWVDAVDFNLFEPRLTLGNSTEYPGKK